MQETSSDNEIQNESESWCWAIFFHINLKKIETNTEKTHPGSKTILKAEAQSNLTMNVSKYFFKNQITEWKEVF